MRTPLLLTVGLLLTACPGGDPEGMDAGKPPADAGKADAGSVSDAGTADAGPPRDFTLRIGPSGIATDVESTKCVTLNLGNTVPIHVGTLHTVLRGDVHQLVVSAVAGSAESTVPVNCAPGSGFQIPDAGNPLTFTQRADETLALPAGAGFTLAAGQLIRLELHTGPASTDAGQSAEVTFTRLDDSAFTEEAAMVVAEAQNLSLAPGSAGQSQATFNTPFLAGKRLLALTGGTHRHGTQLKVELTGAAAPTTLLLSTSPFLDTAVEVPMPPVQVSAAQSLALTCSYQNDDGRTVVRGSSFETDERCWLRVHYAASAGPKYCLGGFCF